MLVVIVNIHAVRFTHMIVLESTRGGVIHINLHIKTVCHTVLSKCFQIIQRVYVYSVTFNSMVDTVCAKHCSIL